MIGYNILTPKAFEEMKIRKCDIISITMLLLNSKKLKKMTNKTYQVTGFEELIGVQQNPEEFLKSMSKILSENSRNFRGSEIYFIFDKIKDKSRHVFVKISSDKIADLYYVFGNRLSEIKEDHYNSAFEI